MADIVEKHIEKAKQMIDCTNLKEIRQFLRQVETEFDISICIKSSSHYSPMIFFDYVRAFLPFARSDDKDIVAAVLNFFDYFFPILITYSPMHFLDGCYEIYQIEQNPPNLCPILRYMALAINGQTIEVEEKYTPMILSILSSTSNADKELLFPFVWQSIAKQINLTECNALLEQMTTPNFGEAVAILAAAHPQELIPSVLTNSNFDFIKSFLSHLKTDYVIELDDYINTLAITNQPELLAAFINSNISLGEVSLDLAQRLCRNIASDITDYPAENRAMLLSALSNAVIRGLINPADLKPAIDCNSDIEDYKRTSIKVLLTHLLDGFQQILEDIYENDSKALYYVLNNLDISLTQMFDKDPKWTHDFVQKIIAYNQSSPQILKIINKYPLTDLIGVDKIVYSNLNTTNIEIAKLIFKISKKYGFQHSLASLDWILNPNISFEIIRSPDVQFTIELIHSSLSPPSALQGMLRALRLRPRAAAPLFFEELLSLAKLSVKPLRVFIDQEERLPKINWISQMSINKLFFLSRAPFTHTQYGMFNLEIIRTFQEFFNFATNCNHMQCMILMRYLRLFATSFPETVVPLAINCYNKYRTDTMKNLLENISKENFAPRFATFEFRLKYELYGIESALDIGKNSMVQAARYDREVAQILATELTQPLENMKTFLSFVNIDHHIPWARECAKQLPVSDWILQDGDLILLDAIAECNDVEIKQKVAEAKQIVENLISNEEKVKETVPFKFERVEVNDEKEKISEMISYLWFNCQKLSNEKENELIDLIYKTDDDKLLLGGLIYSELNKIDLDYKIIGNRIHAKSDIQIAISYVYFKNQKSDWDNLPDYLKEIVDRVLSEVNVKKSDIFEQIYINSNLIIRKLLFSMLEMDEKIKEKLNNQTIDTFDFTSVNQIKIGLSQIFSKIENDDICINNRNLPTVYKWPSEFLLYGREKKYFTSPHLPIPDKKWIFAAADNNDSLSYYLKFVDPSAKDIQRFDPEWKYLFPCLSFSSTKSDIDLENLSSIYYFLPPSFSRAFYRSIFSKCANMLPQKLFDQLSTVLPHVPPMTIPKNSSFLLKSDTLFNDKISVIDICNSGDYSNVSKLQELANNGNIDALLVLSNIPQSELMKRLDLSDPTIAVNESARSALEYSLKRGVHYSLMYIEMIKTIKIISMAEIVAIVCNKRFLMACNNDSSFVAALAVFRRIEKEAKGTDYEPMFQCYREMSSVLFKNEKYKKWFSQTKLEVSDLI